MREIDEAYKDSLYCADFEGHLNIEEDKACITNRLLDGENIKYITLDIEPDSLEVPEKKGKLRREIFYDIIGMLEEKFGCVSITGCKPLGLEQDVYHTHDKYSQGFKRRSKFYITVSNT